jgi:hypothetical protein
MRFILLFILSTAAALAGTCTTIERTNYSANQVLTSTSLNTQFNNIYAPFNDPNGALDGGCVEDGTLELSALNTSEFAPLLNYIREGCKVTRSDANTLAVDKCYMSVNGNFVQKSTSTTVTWGCTDCASETASTDYYLYAKTGSIGSTLNLLISTTAPNGDGYDNSSNRILGKFRNNGSSNIHPSVQNWQTNGFDTGMNCYSASISNDGSSAAIVAQSKDSNGNTAIQQVSRSTTGIVEVTFVTGFFDVTPSIVCQQSTANDRTISCHTKSTAGFTSQVLLSGTANDQPFDFTICRLGNDTRIR